MKDTIVFCLNADNEESYSEIANFIYKRERREIITDKEVQRVSYKYYFENRNNNAKEWVHTILKDHATYQNISEPHKIKNITEHYEIIYCFWIAEGADIIDLNNLYLIKQHYVDLNIVILFSQCNDSQYFSVSQFLYSVGIKDHKFYNECYFDNKGDLKRAQIKNISFSRAFTPLQLIDKDNIKRLFRKCSEIVTIDYIKAVSSGQIADSAEYDDLLAGAIKILKDTKKKSTELFEDQYIQVLQKLDVLAFVLLCYVLCQKTDEWNISLFEKYAFLMQQYSNAVHQLVENIVFHSKTGRGIIAFRVHDKKSPYISKKYKVENVENNFLEIIVSDFCRDNSSGNISHNFILNLQNDEIKAAFKELHPREFFDHDSDKTIKDAWEEFYRNPDNIGRHFGLRIFQSVVSAFGGMFGAESHCGYTNIQGDSYLSYEGNEAAICMPGTRYHIVLPLENVQRVFKDQDLSLDSGIDIGSRINDYLNYTVGEMALSRKIEIPQSQKQKNDQIKRIADDVQSGLEKLEENIIYISLDDIEDSAGEIIAKALVIALFRLKNDLKIVLYQCTDNLKKSIFDTIRIFFHNVDIEGMFFGRSVQIIMYSNNFEETVLDLSSSQKTDNINAYIAHMKCITSVEGYINPDLDSIDLNQGATSYIPCDVLQGVKINDKKQTLFEHYTEKILERNIQKNEFGCQLEHTHMRLGSTIHIDKFYEAEILFGNKLFVSRFALLLVKDMMNDIKDISKLTLYGYGTYSETVLVQMIEMINYLYSGKKDVDYIILEREEERRGFLHKDRIRYNKYFQSREERVNYFKDRKVAIVVLINSTLKTHMRLINLFREENEISVANNNWLIRNYAVLLIGNADGNGYWKLQNNSIILLNENISPVPQYFIQVNVNYKEPSECGQCFPTNPVAEVPLIEVNAASTIPNQAFGIVENTPQENLKLNYEFIRDEEEKLECLKNEFVYGHVYRNENHFLYYFKTENICIKQTNEIKDSLIKWKNGKIAEERLQYNIIVSPMHFSNAGFVELVNNVVFGGNAILLRIDFDKEYRCNAYTKYSYLRNYIEQLSLINPNGIVRVHFVDDAIISGRTFHRAKSLMQSVLDLSSRNSKSIEIKVFDKVFVLVDRNSIESRNQYVDDSKSDFYAFVSVKISSLRNYGDSCVYCNLKKEADLLFDTASTKSIADYWNHCTEKFKLYSLEEYNDNYNELDYEKQFRRLFCTHMAQCVLKESYHGNDNIKAIYIILKLLNIDFESREKDKFEYFLSYLKCISRPFLVFKKAIKEAIFDILLILIDAIVCDKTIREVIKGIELDKVYLTDVRLIRQFNRLNKNILQNPEISDDNKKDLVRLLMKQLTELKSNYIIRPVKMDAIFAFMENENKEEFEKDYLKLIDRLVGASSDTNKSVWLDNSLINGKYEYVSLDFKIWVLLENTRAFRDGIEKLYTRIYEEKTASKEFCEVVDTRINELETQYDYKRTLKMFDAFESKYCNEMEEFRNFEKQDSERIHNMKKRIKRFLKSLPDLKTLNIVGTMNSVSKSTDNWGEIFSFIKKEVAKEYVSIEKIQEINATQLNLLKWIDTESDMYQYSNFYKLLKEEGYMEGGKMSADGADMAVCCVKILELCRNKGLDILKKIQLLAILFKVILRAQKIQFIIENKANNNLDEWKQDIEKQYNEIIDKESSRDTEQELKKISIKGKKHYSVIVEKAGSEDYNTEVSAETEKLIENLECQLVKQRNYVIDKKSGVVIWKLENNQRSIWINMENPDWQTESFESEMWIAKDVRKIMMFYQELMRGIFNPENDDYIKEISHARKELSIYNSNKIHTHTKDYSKNILFDQAQNYFLDEGHKKQYMSNYPSHILKLLADINISQYYRNGLKVTFYQDDRGIKNAAKWEDFAGLIKNQQEFTYCINKKETVTIHLEVLYIDKNDEILCRNNPDSIREMLMLIYALILNAAEQNRGKREIQNTDIQSEGKRVIVKIYKEEGYLVIENECEDPVDLEEIRRKLQHVPDSEDDGISLWSFNCYIRRCINSLILAKLKEMDENQFSIKGIKAIGEWINKLMSQECEIQLGQTVEESEGNSFRVKLPIFMEMYRCSEKGESA